MVKNKSGMVIDQIAADWAEEVAQETPVDPSKSFLPAGAQKERLKGEFTQVLNTHFTTFATGINQLLDRLEQLIDAKNPEIDEKIYADILNKMSEKKTEEGFTEDELKICFLAAVDLYNNKEYEQAADVFYVLTVFDPTRPLFWKCLGSAKFFGNNFKDAFDAYAMAFKINPQDPECLLYQARCLQNEGRIQEAIDTLQQASDIIAIDPQFADLKDRVTALVQDLKQ